MTASGAWSYRSSHRLQRMVAARPEETIGTSLVRHPSPKYLGRSSGNPAPEMIRSISSSMAAFTMSA